MDYFGARYYSSVQGRFTSVDPENAGASYPESWNGYTYSLNNPLRFIDPDGLRWAQVAVDGGIYYQWFDDITKDDNGQTEYARALNAGFSAVTFDESQDFSFANGIFAPGETITTVKLGTDGKVTTTEHTVTWGQWATVAMMGIGGFDTSKFPHQNLAGSLTAHSIISIIGNGNSNISIDVPLVPPAATLGPIQGPPHPRETARKLGAELVEKFKKAGEGVGRSGGGGEKYKQAGAQLIREANKLPRNNALREAMKTEGQRLINYGKGVSHK